MRKIGLFLCLTLVIFIFSGCAARTTNAQIFQPNTSFKTAKAQCGEGIFSQRLQEEITKQLTLNQIPIGDDLLIICNFIRYDEGNRFGRWLLPGLGRGNSVAEVVLQDKNGQKVMTFMVYDKISGGMFGGNSDVMITNTATNIVRKVYYFTHKKN